MSKNGGSFPGSNSTAEAISLTAHAKEAGADGALLLSPYYNKPTQEGIYEHYSAVARETALPLVIYNIPGRTASNIAPETIGRSPGAATKRSCLPTQPSSRENASR